MEFNVDKQIKGYWSKFIGITDANNEEFADATSENSVRASKFLEGLNLDPIMPEINKYYSVKEYVETYPRRAMVKTVIWRNIITIKYYTKEARYLETHPDEALELGFNIDPDGKYNGHYKKEMVKAHITMDYEHNIPLAKKVCGGTANDDEYLKKCSEWLQYQQE